MTRFKQTRQSKDDHLLDKVKLDFLDNLGEPGVFNPQTRYLGNYLENYEEFIDRLILKFKSVNHSVSEIAAINAIRETSDADLILILQNQKKDWVVKLQSEKSEQVKSTDYQAIISNNILLSIDYEYVFNPLHYGICKTYEVHEEETYSKAFIILPLKKAPQAEVMVICGVSFNLDLFTEVYGKIVSSFYQASLLFDKIELIEAAILDNLKFNFGFISSSLYQRRFNLFCQRLKQMVVYFEPVLHIEPEDLFISGWEALARNPENHMAPSDLFTTVELWGSSFSVELDQHFLKVATERYRHARKLTQRRASDVVPLSVNVYPESLMRAEYFETVKKIIQDKIISPRNLILEISEKTDLPHFINGVRLINPLHNFKKQLLEYVSKLKVRFAIDDFGVGYASVSRLAGLNPSHVKIDRELLYNHSSDIIIRFVHDLVGANNLNPAKVIVEGIDETAPISLRSLREVGVSYIQGHLVGKPNPEVYRLSQEKYNELKKRLLQ